ncbi:hypothetical protein BGZ94_005943 [Podila epigama]|nr:hypothetical protein BGZ94_005943 [Podila epigama]
MDALPPECIEPILKILRDTDIAALARTMRCSRSLFETALPILYSDPFTHCPNGSKPKLFDILLASAQLSTRSFFVSNLSCQCNRSNCPVNATLAKVSSSSSSSSSSPHKTVATTTACYIDALVSFDGPLWMTHAVKSMPPEYRKLAPKFFLEIMNTVISRSHRRLNSLVLVPGFVSPILEHAPTMANLAFLWFSGGYDRLELARVLQFLKANTGCRLHHVNLPKIIIGKQADCQGHHNLQQQQHHHHHHHHHNHNHHHHHYHHHHLPQPNTPTDTTLEANQSQQLQLQLQLQQHADATINNSHEQQLQLILSLGQPSILDANECQDFPFIAHRIPCHHLSKLYKFKYVLSFVEGDGNAFLRRCRALRELDFAAFDKDVFAWAAAESQDMVSSAVDGVKVQETMKHDHDLASRKPERVNLSELRMAVSEWMAGRILRSVSQGFGHSLETMLLMVYDHTQLLNVLCPHTIARIQGQALPDVPFVIDSTFHCPKLKKFRIIRATASIKLGPGAFEGCPMLENLQLNGSATCAGEGETDFGVWRIPALRLLELGHGIAHQFRFESLAFSPMIESIALRDCMSSEVVVYSDTVYPSSGPWTWTLDHLDILQLSGRPAYQFRFEWLRQAPNLTTLVVDGVHSAALVPNPADISKGPCGGRLTSCNLQVHMQHDFDRNQLATLLETYCPKVEQLRLLGRISGSFSWKPIDLGLALYATRNLTSLVRLKLHGGYQQSKIAVQALRYGLVRGTIHGSDNKLYWRHPEDLKQLEIEALDGGEGCNVYRQKKCCVFRD